MATRILIADDSPIVRQCLGRLLRGHTDWEVCGEASDGNEALELACKHRPDILVLDVSLPLMNGLAVTRRSSWPGWWISTFALASDLPEASVIFPYTIAGSAALTIVA